MRLRVHHSRPATGLARRAGRAGLPGLSAFAVAGTLALAACTSGDGSTGTTTAKGAASGARAGGTLTAMSLGPVASWDPQRIGSRADMAFAGRTFVRTLTAYDPTPGRDGVAPLTGDLATDTGKASADQRTWRFTLRDGVTWQDGAAVTCEDVKYGISRTFATKQVTGGPTYALALLDIPINADGTSQYAGPYATGKGSEAGRKAYDRAVSCSGPTITFRLAAPTADFDETLSLPAFAPYPRKHDDRDHGTYAVWSTGPYQLQGDWQQSEGGTFVRNPHWDKASDPIRKAYPDQIRYQEGMETQTVAQRIMADGSGEKAAVALDSAPPAMQQQVAASAGLRSRAVNPGTGLVDYLAPNVRSKVFAKAEARQALAVATNRDAYVTALGGSTAATTAYSLIPSGLTAHRTTDLLHAGGTGDPKAAAALLARAGLRSPVRITVAYRSTETADRAMAALAAGWTKAGFEPELKPITDDYFAAVAGPTLKDVDVFWSNWAPEWASASTVLPPLFDSRINLSDAGTGRDYGYFSDEKVNARMTQLQSVGDRETREKGWADLDDQLLEDAVYVPLVQRRAMYLAGSDVHDLAASETLGGYIDLAAIGAK